MRKAWFLCFLKVSVCHLYLINLSLEREIIIFVLEKVWKKSWILDPKLCETCTFKSRQKSLQTEKVPNGQKRTLENTSEWAAQNCQCASTLIGLFLHMWCHQFTIRHYRLTSPYKHLYNTDTSLYITDSSYLKRWGIEKLESSLHLVPFCLCFPTKVTKDHAQK